MRCSSLCPTRWLTRLRPSVYAPTAAVQAEAPSATGRSGACWQTPGTSAARGARDCRRSNGHAAVMQVRPLSVSSGIAGSSPFGRSPFGPLGWL
jgi:hypothetical protein